MNKINFKKLVPHLTAILVFVALSITYFYPVLEGYELKQGDVEKHQAMAHEIRDHIDKNEETIRWSGNMFAGMPTYMTASVRYDYSVNSILFAVYGLGLPKAADVVFMYLLGFYILLLCLRVNPWLSILGAIAFGFSSYFFIIIEAGHSSKAFAISMMAPLLGGFLLALRGNLKVGLFLIAVFTTLMLYVNHFQIAYYLFFVMLFVGIGELIGFAKKKELPEFFKRVGFILVAVFIGILPNLGNLMLASEYAKESTRGQSDLTISPDGNSNQKIASTGLDKDYITQWSYGLDETFTLIIPNAKGGNSYPILGKPKEVERIKKEDPKFFNVLVSEYQTNQNAISSYFGNQPIVSGPVYVGILVVFLAILALVCLRRRILIALAAITFLTILLAWGKNFMGLTDFFIDYVPGYNKFRAVAMILVVAEFTLPIMAVLFLKKLIEDREFILKQKRKFLITSGVFIAILGIIYLAPSSFIDMSSDAEKAKLNQQISSGNTQALDIQSSIVEYREEMVSSSTARSLIILVIGCVLLWLFLQGKIKSKLLLGALTVLILGDLWSINKEYINNEKSAQGSAANKYVAWQKPEVIKMPFTPSAVDEAILNTELKGNPEIKGNIENRLATLRKENKGRVNQRKVIDITYSELMEATHYRVLNTNARLDQDVQTPYFHKSLGGYHGAKLKEYQELIDFYLAIEHYQVRQAFARGGRSAVESLLPAMQITNMLNAKYIVGPDNSGQSRELVIRNPNAMGNAWFVNQFKIVPNADSAILALRNTNLRNTAVVQKSNASQLEGKSFSGSANSTINLKSYYPTELVYSYSAGSENLAVFSEIYYSPGWKVFIDGKQTDFFKVNYCLRGMVIPQGKGEITFKFEPKTYEVGKVANYASMLLFLGLFVFIGYSEFTSKKTED